MGSSVRVWVAPVVLALMPVLHVDVTADQPGGAEGGVVPNEVVVVFRNGVPQQIEAWVEDLGGTLLLLERDLGWVSVEFENPDQAEDAIRRARARADVVAADRDRLVQAFSGHFVPNDPLYASQWGHPSIRAPGAWAISLGSQNVSVAVMDTGINGLHVDLAPNLCGPHKSYVATPALTDPNGHGTHVAGTISAVTNNSTGVSGLSQSCLMDVKVLDADGSGTDARLASGINWARKNGAHVISMSLGSSLPLYLTENASKLALQDGIVLVAAVGNDGCPLDVAYPARYPAVIAVSALNSTDGAPAPINQCGPEVEVSAPGREILSTLPAGYGNLSGTSMAVPHVSGTIALMRSVAPAIAPQEIRSTLNNTADDVWESGWDDLTGWGRVNATAAVAAAAGS